MQENEPQKLVEKVAGDIESLLDRKVQALKVGAGVGLRVGQREGPCVAQAMSWPLEFRLGRHRQGSACLDVGS